ncbi:MAG: DNA replication and repair protein RecF [Oligoflexia bacterium]|nr:DNA replication and repair protein RecF [Oligoflexia bacterium]
MYFETLKVKNFRNLKDVEINTNNKVNLFLGHNAQGKTSLLESIYFVTFLKSFRAKTPQECINFDENTFQIDTKIINEENKPEFVKIRFSENERVLQLNEKNISKNKFLGKIKAVEFSPDSLSAVKQGPELRRDLIDQACVLFYNEAALAQADFLRVLKQRNAILNSFKREEINLKTTLDLLESVEHAYLSRATDVTYLRIRLLEELLPFINEVLSEIFGTQVSFETQYKAQDQVINSKQFDQINNILKTALKEPQNAVKERVLGLSCAGPHRHVVDFIYDGKNSRFFSSQGQQRAVILAFKMAQIVYHKKTHKTHPILLLDDVLSEFDENKQKYLLSFLQKSDAQTFLTTTNYGQKIIGAKEFILEFGKVRTNGT